MRISSLSQSRNKTLTKPLEANEVGFLHEDKTVSRIVKDLRRKKYGPYLVGGVVGTGKTSQIEIATHLAVKNPLVVHIKFYDQEEYRNKFEEILLSNLIKTVRENLDRSSKGEKLLLLLNACEENLKYTIDEIVQEKKAEGENSQTIISAKDSASSNFGISASIPVSVGAVTKMELSGEVSRDLHHNQEKEKVITKSRVAHRKLESIYMLLEALSDFGVIVIYDELDKMNEDALDVLFSKYKELFVEKDMFSFFVVDERIYRKYQNPALVNNPICTYFMNAYYVPLLRLDESLRYVKRCFAENDYIKGLLSYYSSLGNYRVLNQLYSMEQNQCDGMSLGKAYILKKTVQSLKKQYFDDYMTDVLVRKVKAVIEHMILIRKFQVAELAEDLKQGKFGLEIWPDYTEIIYSVIKVIKEICPEMVTENSDTTKLIDGEKLIHKALDIRNLILCDEREIAVDKESGRVKEEQRGRIQEYDMYGSTSRFPSTGVRRIEEIWEDVTVLKVADNNPDSYRDILIRILETSFLVPHIQVLVMRRARGEASCGFKDYEYTGMIIVEKEAYQVAYYVDRGSYDLERKGAIIDLIEQAEKFKIAVCKATLLELIDIEKEIQYIASRYNQRSDVKEDLRLVFDDWKK